MPLLAGDIRFARSVNMADVPEGGGPPSAQLLTSGRSNEILPDISEETRTVGRVEIYQIFSVLRNTDRTAFMGSNTILAEPPADPNVSITLLSLKDPFATRADIAKRIEAGMSPGPEWAGYLLENHYQTMRSVTLLQRPGMSPPAIGRTYLLIFNEGLAGERRQRVRIKSTDTQLRLFIEIVNGQLIDFQAQVTTCELFDGLLYDFPGSPPTRSFARQSNKTVVRETVYSDSGMFCGASRLTAPSAPNDVWLQLASIYTQIVPNSRTEVAVVDQNPSARKTVVLATAPRRVEVGITPHTQRIRVLEENAGMIYVAQLRPMPEPSTLFIDFWSLGNRYTLIDDGEGRLTGQGSGSVSYMTGALQMTLKSLPDVGSSITIAHGTRLGYDDRSGQAGYRAPEFAWAAPHKGLKPGTMVITWLSGGVTKTATDNGNGGFTGDATGEVNYAAGQIFLRPTAMLDAGGEFSTTYSYAPTVTKNFAGVMLDAGGFGSLVLDEEPAPKSVSVQWITVRNVSASSGTSEIVSSSGTDVPAVAVVQPPINSGNVLIPNTEYTMPGNTLTMSVYVSAPQAPGAYTWEVVATQAGVDASVILQGGTTSGTFNVAAPNLQIGDMSRYTGRGGFALQIAANCPDLYFVVLVKNQALTTVASSNTVVVDAVGDQPAAPPQPPQAAVQTRDPDKPRPVSPNYSATPIEGMGAGGVDDEGRYVFVALPVKQDPVFGPHYDPPASVLTLWTAAEITAGSKQMQSVKGTATVYQIWK